MKAFLTEGSGALMRRWKFSKGNLLSMGRMPEAVLMAASTVVPDLNLYWRKKEFLGNIWEMRSLRICSPRLPLSLGLLSRSWRSFIERPISEKEPASFLRSEMMRVALWRR